MPSLIEELYKNHLEAEKLMKRIDITFKILFYFITISCLVAILLFFIKYLIK